MPEITQEFISAVQARLEPVKQVRTTKGRAFYEGATWVPETPVLGSRTDVEPSLNQVQHYDDVDEFQLPDLAQKVLDLKHSGVSSKIAIIEEVWGVKKGGSDKYKSAVEEYNKLCDMLVDFGLLKSENR